MEITGHATVWEASRSTFYASTPANDMFSLVGTLCTWTQSMSPLGGRPSDVGSCWLSLHIVWLCVLEPTFRVSSGGAGQTWAPVPNRSQSPSTTTVLSSLSACPIVFVCCCHPCWGDSGEYELHRFQIIPQCTVCVWHWERSAPTTTDLPTPPHPVLSRFQNNAGALETYQLSPYPLRNSLYLSLVF